MQGRQSIAFDNSKKTFQRIVSYDFGCKKKALSADDDRIVSHDAPRFMLYYHRVRDTL